MTYSRRHFWLLHLMLLSLPLMVGCEFFRHWTQPVKERVDKEPIPGAPSKHVMRVSQFIFLSDVELKRDQPIFKDLTSLRDQVYRELRLPPSNTEVFVYLFEDKARYERFIHGRHPELPDRRAFFVKQARRMGGVEELMVYTHLGDTIHQDLRHELTHAILHSALKDVPIWLDEGLAEYFELPNNFAGLNPAHLAALRQPGAPIDLARLERLEKVRQMSEAEYRESWAWVHWMLRSTPQAKEALLSYLKELRGNANPGPLRPRLAQLFVSPDHALQSHLAELDRKLPRGVTARR
ncbi:MAG: DUF1570 domain-containing protein [Planctomycetes bacterium]|nr:DUF1570 domain-containing protein [Planctomycetota bacterium]